MISEHTFVACTVRQVSMLCVCGLDDPDAGYDEGLVSVVVEDAQKRVWAVVSDISETLDSKFQASLLSSDQNKRRTAYVKGCPRDLALWVFVPRMKDLCDGREFNGTVDQVRRFPSNETIPYVFSAEENIICEGFALTPEGYLPDTVIAKVKARLSESQ